ncbi:NADH:ubiquinone oxidoreductase [Desulfobacterales bacterium HSG17]|nr:NADH:ubiquinone oxidoreductase [Desulfobacterales bacterium HSG17]
MAKTLLWVQAGGCGGDSMALLNMEWPNILELLRLGDIEILWHPSLSNGLPKEYQTLLEGLISEEQPLDFLCIEGAVVRGPGGTGMYDVFQNVPKKNLIARLAKKAEYVVAVGTCAAFGGIGADGDIDATGLQFHKHEQGGFLGKTFVARSGLPVVNLPGCPCHPDVIAGALSALASGENISLNQYNAPEHWYGLLIHQGCIRNEYHEYRIEEDDFGKRGCMFFHMGCRGPLTYGPCNKLLWNGRSTKTSVGVPCFGCTHPDFPQEFPFFHTRNIAGIPTELPEGVDRAHYLAYKGMAAAAAPDRLKDRKTRV